MNDTGGEDNITVAIGTSFLKLKKVQETDEWQNYISGRYEIGAPSAAGDGERLFSAGHHPRPESCVLKCCGLTSFDGCRSGGSDREAQSGKASTTDIVSIYDVEKKMTSFISCMEYVEGMTLKEYSTNQRPLHPKKVSNHEAGFVIRHCTCP